MSKLEDFGLNFLACFIILTLFQIFVWGFVSFIYWEPVKFNDPEMMFRFVIATNITISLLYGTTKRK